MARLSNLIVPLAMALIVLSSLALYQIFFVTNLAIGSCHLETNKLYFKDADIGTIYRIDNIIDDVILVSTYTEGKWNFLADRPLDYFEESDTFIYTLVECPIAINEPVTNKNKTNYLKALEVK